MTIPVVLAIVGPTASGKTAVARELAKKLPSEIISCDSMQVYRGMPIVSQAPPPLTSKGKGGSRIHLVQFLSPTKEYSAALFRKDASALIREILKKKKYPLLVGGTGLYLRALFDGLFESGPGKPANDETLRKKLYAEQETHGGAYLHDRLKKVDPASAVRIHPNDIRRTVRALEVFHLTGKPFSAQKADRKGIREEISHRIFFLDPDRNDLYERIDRRAERMFREGLVGEVKGLLRKKLSRTARMALGIREVADYLEGRLTLDEAKELLKKNTRHYAKRQLSWFRHEKGAEKVPVAPGETARHIAEKIRRSL